MADAIRLALSNPTVTLSAIGLIASIVTLWRAPRPLTAALVVDTLFFYYLLLLIGVGFLFNFVMHTFFGAMTARFIGWDDSPFQAEVGFASLGFAVVGFLACWRGFDLRLAAVVGPALFLLGAAGGHLYQIVHAQNFAPGNAGAVLYADVLIPIVGFVLLWLQHRYPRAR